MYSFSVRLYGDTVIDDDPCVFGTVDLNIGDGYDVFSGKYYQRSFLLSVGVLVGYTSFCNIELFGSNQNLFKIHV